MRTTIIALSIVTLAACQDAPSPATGQNGHGNHSAHQATREATTNDYADSVNRGIITTDTLKGSPQRMAMANIGRSHVHIEYSAPGVKNRVIWGGLVPYDQVWASGAHHATAVNFSQDVQIMGKPIKAGTYAFFTIPGKDNWTIILNTRFDQHLTDQYNAAEDVARFTVTPQLLHETVQRLTYAVEPGTDSSGQITLAWEKIKIALPVTATPR